MSGRRGGTDAQRCHSGMVCSNRSVGRLRRGRYPHHSRVASLEMGLRTGHPLHRSYRRAALCTRLPRAAPRHARTIRRCAMAADPRLHDALYRGDGVGILAGAVIGGFLELPAALDITMEYVLGFGIGLGIFQALFMRDMVGGSYPRALARSFVPELTSMNCLMAGMIPVAMILKSRIPGAMSPLSPAFWFVRSMALMTGFIAAYPMNWWLVARRLKHGMLTVRRAGLAPEAMAGMQHQSQGAHQPGAMPEHSGQSAPAVPGITIGIAVVFDHAGRDRDWDRLLVKKRRRNFSRRRWTPACAELFAWSRLTGL